MGKHRHVAQPVEEKSVLEASLNQVQAEKLPIEEMPLESMRDYRLYNEEARRLNKKLRLCRYPIKQCPVDLHPKQRVVFRRNDQPTNPLPVFVSDDKIHYDETLIPGKTYDLPEYIVHYLAEKGDPVWDWVTLPDGSRETRVVTKKPRFSLTQIYQD
jgi:hypothetical protein